MDAQPEGLGQRTPTMPKHEFKKLVSARFLYAMAMQSQSVVLGWQMYVLTHNPLFLGLIGLVEAIPALSLSLFSGYWVDRNRPLKILRSVMGVGLLSGALLLFSHLHQLHFSTRTQIIALFASAFLAGVARSFFGPSVYTLVARIVPRENLPKASAAMTSAFQTAMISGPALGGLLFGWVGILNTAAVMCAIIICALVSSLLIQTNPEPAAKHHPSHVFKKELLSGANFVFKHPILLPALTLDMISVLFGGVVALLPIYAAEILKIGPSGLGILRAAPSVGAAIVSLTLTRVTPRKHAGKWLFSAVTGFGCCILVFAISTNYTLSLLALGFSGAFDSVSAVIRNAIVTLSSPDELRGRISSVNMIFISSSNELGEFESGIAAKLLGTVPSAIFGGIACLITIAIAAIFCPKLRNLDLNEL